MVRLLSHILLQIDEHIMLKLWIKTDEILGVSGPYLLYRQFNEIGTSKFQERHLTDVTE